MRVFTVLRRLALVEPENKINKVSFLSESIFLIDLIEVDFGRNLALEEDQVGKQGSPVDVACIFRIQVADNAEDRRHRQLVPLVWQSEVVTAEM